MKNINGAPIAQITPPPTPPVNNPKITPIANDAGIHNHRNIARITFPIFITFASTMLFVTILSLKA
jgi:hypothetical protein